MFYFSLLLFLCGQFPWLGEGGDGGRGIWGGSLCLLKRFEFYLEGRSGGDFLRFEFVRWFRDRRDGNEEMQNANGRILRKDFFF